MKITELDPATVSFAEVRQTTEMILDAFQTDDIFKVLLGPRYFTPVPPPSGQLASYRKHLFTYSLSRWLQSRQGRRREWLMNAANGDLVAYVCWTIPEPLIQPLSLWRRLKNWVLGKAVKFAEAILYAGEGDLAPPNRLPGFRSFFDRIDKQIGWLQNTEDKLAYLTGSELAETLYHPKYMWWCNMMAVNPRYQRQGHGYDLFKYSLEQIHPYHPTFVDKNARVCGPAQYGLFASHEGESLYKKCGFSCWQECSELWDDSLSIEMPLYMKVLEN